MKNPVIIFITGTSGAGKSTLKRNLEDLNTFNLYVHDFDEAGVPENADEAWRRTTTEHWVAYALNNRARGISTVILGQSVPGEVQAAAKKLNVENIRYGFIDVDETQIRERLTKRNWDARLIQANINWAEYLKADVLKQKHHVIIEATDKSEAVIASFFRKWISER